MLVNMQTEGARWEPCLDDGGCNNQRKPAGASDKGGVVCVCLGDGRKGGCWVL